MESQSELGLKKKGSRNTHIPSVQLVMGQRIVAQSQFIPVH